MSAWLGVRPGALITSRHNVLFDSDSSYWLDRMVGHGRSLEQTIHPLELSSGVSPVEPSLVWRDCSCPPDYASIFGPRLLVALFAGAGVGFLAYLALAHLGVAPVQGLLLLGSYFLFTNNTTISLPEHFGISNGLLSMSFVVLIVTANERLRNGVLAGMVVLCSGTSIPNGLFPALCFFDSVIK